MALVHVPRPQQLPAAPYPEPERPPLSVAPQQPEPQIREELPLEPPPPETIEPILPVSLDDDIEEDEVIRRAADDEEVDEPAELSEDIDLDQLAEDVLPLVKRILEIESERLSKDMF
jgi:hypothetical protein